MLLEKKVLYQMCMCFYLCLVMVCYVEDVLYGYRLILNYYNYLLYDVYY